jgi:S-DNA-T family DNA segregation ATPase FtsK/SpoIIIE
LLGIGMALVGLLTLFSLISSSNGWLSGSWLALLGKLFGWGMYLLPVGLIFLGTWLVLRHFDRLPDLDPVRILGLFLGFALLLVWIQYFNFPADRSANFDLADHGHGGGYFGALGLVLLQPGLGWGGAAVALAAGSLIALALILDVSVLELFRWTVPLFQSAGAAWGDLLRRGQKSILKPSAALTAPQRTAIEGQAALPGRVEAAVFPSQPARESRTWQLPAVDQILEPGGEIVLDDEFDRQRARLIEETLNSFGAPARVVEINRGPTITQFGVEPGFLDTRNGQMRVRVSKIAALADDLALALSAKRIRIQAPVPSKGYVGIEVPNEVVSLVALRDVIESDAFQRLKTPLRFALGRDVAGNPIAADLSAMPHLLIAGATGSGKSVCVNAIICCLLLDNTPDDLRLLMVDPKRVELTGYNGIPHLLAPVVVDLERVVGALQWVAREMDKRYHILAQAGARNIDDYNARLGAAGGKKLPYLVVVIDELADLMMLAPDETERTITRLAQLARATGIHLVIATQRPSVDVVTGLIKANFPARIAFAVTSGVDSRVILDQPGAERLLGRGDMLFQAPDAPSPVRLQGTFVSDPEIQRLVTYWRAVAGTLEPASMATTGAADALPPGIPLKQIPMWEQGEPGEMAPEESLDPLYAEAVDLVRRQGRASISMLQRRLRIGYTRAARLIETMQGKGIVGPAQPGAQSLEVLDYGPAAPPAEE